jgi:hypothetical protein
MGFSRGKDSLAAWLWLRQFFRRIIPFHCACIPHLSFVDRSLTYYEEVLRCGESVLVNQDTGHVCTTDHIEKFMQGAVNKELWRLVFQPIEDAVAIHNLGMWEYDNNDLADFLRDKYGLPEAWVAFGISMGDSLFRRVRIQKYGIDGARHPRVKSFYPCFDWSTQRVVETVKRAGISLPRDYLLGARTIAGVPGIRHLDRMRRLMPDEYRRVCNFYPFIPAIIARNEFRKHHLGLPSECDRKSVSRNDTDKEV